ncbi:ETX/MTX2 family pore-forming toxin, partial [Paenibacillus larvae]|uniref:ETX/MTX2 family pore-forming toxin n=10 Tax=Paenibacillus larvae TaxID=1464 RepID=UPI0023A9C641
SHFITPRIFRILCPNIILTEGYEYGSFHFLEPSFLHNYTDSTVEQETPSITNELTPMFVGKTILTNNTDQEQTFSTNSFSKTITNSVTNSTTHGFKLGAKASAKFQIPLVGETGMELSTEYNFSDTSAKTNSESYTYTATPQNIKVPAHSSVEVIVNLNQVKSKGNVNLLTKAIGFVSARYDYSNYGHYSDFSLGDLAFRAPGKDFSTDMYNKNFAFLKGRGKYEASYGTDFSVTVKPINKNGISKRSVNESYTYKVTPEIKKIDN